jgi:hypothetical protein
MKPVMITPTIGYSGRKTMSSFTRILQRSSKREYYHLGRGKRLGAPTDTSAKDYIARLIREAKNAE